MKNKLAFVLVAVLVSAGLLLVVGNAVADTGTYAKAAPEEEWNRTFGGAYEDYGESAQYYNESKNNTTLEERVAKIEGILEQMDKRLSNVEDRLNHLGTRMDNLEARMDTNFKWIIGIMVTMWIAITIEIIIFRRR
jgi:peptidoglycan hydrolase CwlO-like protein